MMQFLELNDDQKAAVENLVKFASHPDNWYLIGHSQWSPGDRVEYCLHLNNYRTVFTISKAEDKLYRHLSLSFNGKAAMHPIIAFTIAAMFGFTNAKIRENDVVTEPGPDWQVGINKKENSLILLQEVEEDDIRP